MTKAEKIALAIQLKKQVMLGEEWINKLPSELMEAHCNNPYTDALHKMTVILLKRIYSAEDYLTIDGFLYDSDPVSCVLVEQEGKWEWKSVSSPEELLDLQLKSD
jgi:hypothetical protein